MPYCKYCGSAVDSDAVFCTECGKQIKTQAPQVQAKQLEEQAAAPVTVHGGTIAAEDVLKLDLYRVNKYGHFNVPYAAEGRTVNFNTDGIRDAAMVLAKAKIQCIDYHDVLMKVAQPGDFVFLDPPYIPISEYSDFKRYTKEQFSMQQKKR